MIPLSIIYRTTYLFRLSIELISYICLMPKTDKHRSLIITESLILSFIWLIIFAGPAIFNSSEAELSFDNFLNTWFKLIPFLLLSLINHFVLVPLFLFKKNKWWYLIIALLTAISFVFITSLFKQAEDVKRPIGRHQPRPHLNQPTNRPLQPPHLLDPRNTHPNAIPPRVNAFLIAILILGFDTGLRTAFRWTRLEKEQAALEKEKVKSELAFLRNQVSPHFFMNTLNNIHSLIDFDTEEAKDSIIHLSKLMRHLLYESEADRIAISKEMDFIRHYVDLMKLRYSQKVDINLQIENNIPDINIPPLLFTSYLENAFKHSISYQSKSFIHICIYAKENSLIFTIRNSNPQKKKRDVPAGIGIENSEKRLQLLYGDKYQLITENTTNHYFIKLSLPL